jgi:hypothetical protein
MVFPACARDDKSETPAPLADQFQCPNKQDCCLKTREIRYIERGAQRGPIVIKSRRSFGVPGGLDLRFH